MLFIFVGWNRSRIQCSSIKGI